MAACLHNWGKNCSIKNEPGLNDFGKSQLIQIAKNAKSKAKAVAGQPFANILGRSKGQSTQSYKKFSEKTEHMN